MLAEGLPQVAVDTFAHYYSLLRSGETGTLSRSEISAVEALADSAQLHGVTGAGVQALTRTVVIKLNGGLGTSMGMTRAKSLMPVKGSSSFLDIFVRQVLCLRERYGCRLPLVLMNSYRTRADTLESLAKYPGLAVDGLAPEFLQHKVPRILAETLQPVDWPSNPEDEWCPPGHGDLYTALRTSGMLEALLDQRFEYAFVSNGDNLGAVLDIDILGWFASQDLPLLLEVADRTESDKKGGHLARLRGGGLTLRETAQCPEDEIEDFQDINKYRYFNTNNLWMSLSALERALNAHDSVLPLPMMRNEKHVVATDPSTPKVYQTETAMGAAISVFEGAQALRVPRTRFAPVKTTNDLLKLWSDLYELDEDYVVHCAGTEVTVDLDPRYFKLIGDFRDRFPYGAPSLVRAKRFEVRGDVRFGRGVVAEGEVRICNDSPEPRVIPDGTRLSGG